MERGFLAQQREIIVYFSDKHQDKSVEFHRKLLIDVKQEYLTRFNVEKTGKGWEE